ncbi:Isochorismatase-like protein [Ustulina deusta]|nr:Isochorismatase-like protein [Ustulina deusta]
MTSPLRFGLGEDWWVYHKDKKCYDISRDALGSCFSFNTTQGQPGTAVLTGSRLTALVVVDMQNFFLHPQCNDYPEGLEAAERTVEVVAKCRKLGIQIIWLNWGLTEQDLITMPPAVHRGFSSELIDDKKDGKLPGGGRTIAAWFRLRYGLWPGQTPHQITDPDIMAVAKSWNAELYESLLQVSDAEQDIFCDKNRMSGMWTDKTPLYEAVKGQFHTLLFAGVNTDQCVLGTLVDAYDRGLDCVMLEDCCATRTPGGKEATTWNISRSYGFVTDSKSFCDGIELKTDDEKLSFLGLPEGHPGL